MEQSMNYQKEMDKQLEQIQQENRQEGTVKSLLLHSCCAPCSSYVLEYLTKYFDITILYYNPNISEREEYEKRVEEQKRLIQELPFVNKISFLEGEYHPTDFYAAIKGLENLGERSERCYECYKLRLSYTANLAKEQRFDYFTTTLSISPYKNARWLNTIGQQLALEKEIGYLYADFKKKNGYKRSIALSEKYHLYRQDFCGCIYSKLEEQERKKRGAKSDD